MTVFAIHPASFVLIGLYGAGVALARRDREEPMWRPRQTDRTRADVPEQSSAEGPVDGSPRRRLHGADADRRCRRLSGRAHRRRDRGGDRARRQHRRRAVHGDGDLVAGARHHDRCGAAGALQHAVGGIIGGNMFDVLFLSASDAAYRGGSIYHAIDDSARFWALIAILMTGVLLLGLIRREKLGFATIGLETVTLLALYVAAAVLAAFALR